MMDDAEYVEAEQDIRAAIESYKDFCDKSQLDFEDRIADILFDVQQDTE